MSSEIKSFKDFFPYYLAEHANQVCRILHFIGTTMSLIFLYLAISLSNYWLILAGIVNGYAFAWVGHFLIEKNRPATFKYPLWSFMGDWVMWWGMLRGKHWHVGPTQP